MRVLLSVLASFTQLGCNLMSLIWRWIKSKAIWSFEALYKPLLEVRSAEVKLLLNTYFGNIADAYETVNNLGFDGVGVDLVEGKEENLAAIEHYGVNEKLRFLQAL